MKKWLFLTICILFFSGCNKTIIVNNTDPHVRFSHYELHDWLRLDTINYIKRDDGLVEFEAKFTNIGIFDKTVAYKVDWMDKNNFTIKTIMSKWIEKKITPKRNLIIHGISPSSNASDFIIMLESSTKDKEREQEEELKRRRGI